MKHKKIPLDDREIRIQYTLTRPETRATLIIAGRIEDRKNFHIIETVMLALLFVFFLVQFLTSPGFQYYMGLVLAGICAALAIVIRVIPEREEKRLVEKAYSGLELNVLINREKISIDCNGSQWEIVLNGDCDYCDDMGVMVIFVSDGKLLTIPDRAFAYEREHRFARAIIEAGTHPRARNKW